MLSDPYPWRTDSTNTTSRDHVFSGPRSVDSIHGILPPIQLFLAIAIGIPMYAMSYYFRTVATKRMWRAVFILLGSCFIGFWFILAPLTILLISLRSLGISLPWWLGWPFPMILTLVVGAFIGDWLGKRRDYRPYM